MYLEASWAISAYFQDLKLNIKKVIQQKFPEYYEELKGIVSGAKYKGVNINIDILLIY